MGAQLTDEEIKETEIGILDYIDSVARKNHINYYLDGGTLIGAIRHHGFIPWDDDIDIQLLRKDYERLLKAIQEDNDSRYKLMSMYSQKDYFYRFAKVVDTHTALEEHNLPKISGLGVYVDIFPVDYAPESKRAYKRWGNNLHRLDWWLWQTQLTRAGDKENPYGHEKRNIYANVIGWFFSTFGWKNLQRRYDSVVRAYSDTGGEYTGWKKTVPASCYREPQYVTFEGKQYPALTDYDTYLRIWYGDYMQLPPEEKRASGHDFTARWI